MKNPTPYRKWLRLSGLWLFFYLITLLLYYPTRFAGRVSDYTGWAQRFVGSDWSDVWHCFGYPGLQQVGIGFLYACHQLLGDWSTGWALVYWFFHASNGLLLYVFLRELFRAFEISMPSKRAFVLCLLWLVSCWHVEVMVWRVCQNYFLVVFLSLLAFNAYLRYFLQSSRNLLLLGHLFFLLALFTFEQALVNIVLVALIHVLLFVRMPNKPFRRILVPVYAPMLVLLLAYFIINRIWLGDWVGHYGAEVHLSFDWNEILANYLRYFLKQLSWWRFGEYQFKQELIAWTANYAWPMAFSILGIFSLWFWKFRSQHRAWLSAFFLIACVVLLFPISNLFFYWQDLGENDRYHYVFSLFFYPILAMMILHWRIELQTLLAILIFTIHIQANKTISTLWSENQHVLDHLTGQYRWQQVELVFILNSPDNFGGTQMLSTAENAGFFDYYFFTEGAYVACEPKDVLQFNMKTRNDGVHIDRVDTNTVRVSFNQWGNWWIYQGRGAPDSIETPYYSIRLGKWNDYFLTKKPAADSAVWIYQDGVRYEEFEW